MQQAVNNKSLTNYLNKADRECLFKLQSYLHMNKNMLSHVTSDPWYQSTNVAA